jgi:type II secretory pathway component PulK
MNELAQNNRRGIALPVVLVVVSLLALAGYTFSELMLAEYHAADAHGRALQTRYLCDSGIAKTLRLLKLDPEMLRERGGLYDNPAEFQAIVVVDDAQPERRGTFSIVAPKWEPDTPAAMRFGLEDESAKLNLATLLQEGQETAAQRERLMKLPGMTEETADSILDWIDADEDEREFGAEASYYSGLAPPYAPKNGVPTNVEELLLVRGVTPALLFGLDVDRNGFADPHETGGLLPEGVEADGSFDRGWIGYLTVHSAESNLDLTGAPRVNLNETDLEKLNDALTASMPELASYVVAYRQNGPYTGSRAVSKAPIPPPNYTKPGSFKFKSVLDVVGSKTSVTVDGDLVVIASPLGTDPLALGAVLPTLLDKLTITSAATINGRINVNEAAPAVLLTVPGLTEEKVDQIVAARFPESSDQLPGSEQPTWLLAQGIVTLDEMKTLLPYLTCRGGVYRAQIVGQFDVGGPTSRVEAVFDATSGLPRQLLWRELSHLGRGFSRERLGVGGL